MTNEQITVKGINYSIIDEINLGDFSAQYPNIASFAGPTLARIVTCKRPNGQKLSRFYGFQTKDGIRWQ